MKTVMHLWRKGVTKMTESAASKGREVAGQWCLVVCIGNGLNGVTTPYKRLPTTSAATAQPMQPQARTRASSNRLLYVVGARFLPQSQRPQLFGKGAPRSMVRPLLGGSPHNDP